MGESAGGSLALVAGYAAGANTIEPSCAGSPVEPAGVIAIAPAADLAGIWADRTLWFGDRPFPEAYIGGPPSEYPDRYAAASPFDLIRPGLPPTLIVTGANDHLVLPIRVTSLADRLTAGGADTTLIVVPFADHGFDGPSNGFGAQLLEVVVPNFLDDVAIRTSRRPGG
jgi:acetyl esterase/lipase